MKVHKAFISEPSTPFGQYYFKTTCGAPADEKSTIGWRGVTCRRCLSRRRKGGK